MNSDSPLGQSTDYPDTYTPDLLFAIAREDARVRAGIGDVLPFTGEDRWSGWELTWLSESGRPSVARVEIAVPADSPSIVESKSLKLYLNSYAMSSFETGEAVKAAIRSDVEACIGATIDVRLTGPDDPSAHAIERLPGKCIDDADAVPAAWELQADYLSAKGAETRETLHSHLLRSLCPVTAQPDLGSILIDYRGPGIDLRGLLRYILSYRRHQDFHEACVERMFIDILERCEPLELSIEAYYQRRGGIDINPFRTNHPREPRRLRTWRQ